jgi:signal transduction histidine kinase
MRLPSRLSRQAWGWPVDVVVSATLTAAVLIELIVRRAPAQIDFAVAPVLTSTVAWRRRAPAAAALVGVVSGFVLRDPDPLAQSLLLPIVAVLVYYMLGRKSETRRSRFVDGLLLVLPLPAIWLTPGDSQPIAVISVWLFFFALPYLAGRTIASQTVVAHELERDAGQVEIDQRNAASDAIALERTRIARDLHDVVAHNVSVMAIQAVAARRTAPSDPDTARESLDAVARCGREALVEMRRMVGVLRRSDLAMTTVGEPGLDQVDALAEHARLAGVQVAVHVEGPREALPPARDLVAFRVLQEALTNVIKHAGSSRADVSVRHLPTSVELQVCDDGEGKRLRAPDDGAEPGHGLVGMRERLDLYGGTLRAGPRRRGGYEVRAVIPRSERSGS